MIASGEATSAGAAGGRCTAAAGAAGEACAAARSAVDAISAHERVTIERSERRMRMAALDRSERRQARVTRAGERTPLKMREGRASRHAAGDEAIYPARGDPAAWSAAARFRS